MAERIGDFLLSIGAITKKQIEEVLERQKTEKRMFGEIAIELGYIDDSAIMKWVEHKAEEVLPL